MQGGSPRRPGRSPPRKKRRVKNEPKMSLRSQTTGDFWLAESPGDSFLTLFGGSAGPLRDSPGHSFFWLLEPGRVLTPLPGRGGSQYMQEQILEKFIYAWIHAGAVLALVQMQENSFCEIIFHMFCQILGGIHSSANTCRACECRKKSWQIIFVLVSWQGVIQVNAKKRLANKGGERP